MGNEMRGISFSTMPNRVIMLIEYQDLWREVWTDGRALPTDVGGSGKDALDPRYNGYSVGHWEDDYTFVVDTTRLDDRSWATKSGYPHSIDAHVQERFTRVDHNDLKLTVTMVDPKIYTKPFDLGTEYFRWIPNQEIDEWLCVPSEVMEYLQRMGDPAGSDPNAAPSTQVNRRGRNFLFQPFYCIDAWVQHPVFANTHSQRMTYMTANVLTNVIYLSGTRTTRPAAEP
jgi:hypothetical protein